MSHRILHLISPELRVKIRLDQLWVEDLAKGAKRSVPLEDIAAIVCATGDASFSSGALRGLAERKIPLLVCDEKFCPASITLPCHAPTDASVVRTQVTWSPEWKSAVWQKIIAAKVRNQAHLLNHAPRQQALLLDIAQRCESEAAPSLPLPDGSTLADISPPKRHLYRSAAPDASEARAARHYWSALRPRWREKFPDEETRRIPGSRRGLNARLDYGYAVLRSAVLRSLALHGFITALGVNHTIKPAAHALADDLMEPLRPWVDRRLDVFLQTAAADHEMRDWAHDCPALLFETVRMDKERPRLLYAIDTMVRSLADASVADNPEKLRIPGFAADDDLTENDDPLP